LEHTIEHPTLEKGLSVIEILVVLVIMGIITAIALPRFQDRNSEGGYKKDITYFIENVSRVQASVNADNSRVCDGDEKLGRIDIVRQGTSSYQIITYCALLSGTGNTPTPATPTMFKLDSSEFDDASGTTFVSLFADGTTTPGPGGFIFTHSDQSCTITISETGVITSSDTCPP
jgi:prepilin-type N-terminal cleavage/methylation domain-containing protein